ncbi:MAG: hypothetical protein OXO49_08005 [Gammaproteobacteria bacterium]|nr:hypothetical protein [Gammaproteobacteria bacterium]MDE0251584.1 hypothetical protein [Gammaproteobacteria bacterium]MDE0403406.1 hypothetical protein [Gammaproteobacteria bacterium]
MTKRSKTQPPWNSTFMGVYGGASTYYGVELPSERLFVESGYAAALNLHPTLCPSGPYCWKHDSIIQGLANLGLQSTLLYSKFSCQLFSSNVLTQIQEAASSSLVYVMAMEFQLVDEISEDGFTFTLPWGPEVPVCLKTATFEDLLNNRIENVFGWVQIEKITPKSTEECIRTGLANALDMYQNPKHYPYNGYTFGLAAYDVWTEALTEGEYDRHGHWWNAMVWSECRSQFANYFKQFAPIECTETDQLIDLLERSASHLATTANKDLTDAVKLQNVREAQQLEQSIPELVQKVFNRL